MAEGLRNHGILNLDKALGRDTYSDLKFYAEHGRPFGMSIGYEAVKWEMDGPIRVLTEIAVSETSVTLFPANPMAFVTQVKEQEREREALTRAAEQAAIREVLHDMKRALRWR